METQLASIGTIVKSEHDIGEICVGSEGMDLCGSVSVVLRQGYT